jgi:tRNA-2-methylthio-N6-dimethylallyladenosine synthase
MFKDTINAYKECEFDFVYNARYSVRKGTIAAKIYPDDVPDEIKAKRWHKLNDLLLENIQKRNKMMI